MTTDLSAHRLAVRHSILRSVVIVALLFAAFALLPLRGEYWWIGFLVGALLLVTTIPLAVSRLQRVLNSERPAFEAAEALVQLLAMLLTGFAAVLYGMNRDGSQVTGLDTRIDAIYFAVTVMSTVGFGDIHAQSQAARVVVTLQIIFDLLFVGVAVRVFVGAAKLRGGREVRWTRANSDEPARSPDERDDGASGEVDSRPMTFAYDYPLMGAFMTMLWFFLFVIWIMILFRVFADIFRSHDMGGFTKALWIIFVIFLPFLGILVYVLARRQHDPARDRRPAGPGGRLPVLRQGRGRHERSG